MPYKEAELNVNPSFVLALSGEFRPATQPESTHMLGQLLVATFQKGELVREESGPVVGGDWAYDLAYSPSWAPSVTSRICCLEKGGWTAVRSMYLSKEDQDIPDGDLALQDYPYSKVLRMARVGQSVHRSEVLSLELGSPLVAARLAVTEAAQEFFS